MRLAPFVVPAIILTAVACGDDPSDRSAGDELDVIPASADLESFDDDRTVTCERREFRLGDLRSAQPLVALGRADLEHALTDLAPDVVTEIGVLDPADWILVSEDEQRVVLVRPAPEGTGHEITTLRPDVDGWTLGTWGGVGDCTLEVALPDGLGEVEWAFEGGPPSADATSFTVLATEVDCASGRELGDQLLGPQVVESDEEIRIAFAAIPVGGAVECPGNPPTAAAIELAAPVGDRSIVDGRILGASLADVLPDL
ncbi:MAG: hypothetical protein AAF945_15500 [Actinomycetota bacterium]